MEHNESLQQNVSNPIPIRDWERYINLLVTFFEDVEDEELRFFDWGFATWRLQRLPSDEMAMVVTRLATFEGKAHPSKCKAIINDLLKVVHAQGADVLCAAVGKHAKTTEIVKLYLLLGFEIVNFVNDAVVLKWSGNSSQEVPNGRSS